MNRLFDDAVRFLRFIPEYRRFLKDRLDVDQARAIVRQRMEDRGERFLDVVRAGVFQNPTSPYRPLMDIAGCELGDVEGMVRREGLEEALRELREAGVYFTFEEFKGRKPVVRGSREIVVNPNAFNNPSLGVYYEAESGGSTGRPTGVFIDLNHVAALAPATLLSRSAHGIAHRPSGIWLGVLPDPTGTSNLLRRAKWGMPQMRWFSPPIDPSASWRHRTFTRALVSLGRIFGAPLPSPEPLALGEERAVAQWLAETLIPANGAAFSCHPSKAVRIATVANVEGWSLDGVTFVMGGEPITPAKIRTIAQSGASYVALYSFSEHGAVGEACPDCRHDDEVHVFEDTVAIIQVERGVRVADETVGSFHFTSLLPTAPKILLNVEADDYGVLEQRDCPCELGALGFRTFVRRIRSFSKLTAEGTTLVGSDLESVLEEQLPGRFGGGPLDYQLVEEEDTGGLTHLSLFIHPSVDIDDEDAVSSYFLEAAGAAGGILAQAGSVDVKRREPILTGRGKFMPLQRRSGPA